MNSRTLYGPVATGLRDQSSQLFASTKPRRLMISLAAPAMRPSRVTSGTRLTKRTVYLSTASTFSSDGQVRLAMPTTSGGKVLPSTLSRVITVVNRVLLDVLL